MRRATIAMLLGGVALWAPAALGEDLSKPHTLDKVTITGSKTVPTEKLTAVLREKPGDKVTQADIVADRDAIMKVLGDANVGGSVGVQIATKSSKHLIVEFKVADQGVQTPVVTKVAARLHAEIFTGNKSMATDQLQAASGLKPGDELTNDKILNAEKAIGAAYTAAKLPVSAQLNGETKPLPGGLVDVIWTITETKVKKKRDTEDRSEQLQQ